MNVEIVGMGQCNLKCPSCPVGNMREIHNPMGFMKPEMLAEIVRKGVSEGVPDYGLFNWGEPLLHPRITEMVRAVQDNGGRCFLSSNLNHKSDWDALMASNPHSLRISCSGFTQANYGETHRGGDIEKVKVHMRELAEARTRAGATTDLHMLFHRYKNNLDDERLMRAYCAELGIRFEHVWAYLMPLEKILAFETGGYHSPGLNDEDRRIIDRMGIDITQALAASKAKRNQACTLLENQMTIDSKGDVMLCCGVYEVEGHVIAPYLSTDTAAIQAKKRQHPTCGPCMEAGIHVLAVYGAPEIEQHAQLRTLTEYAHNLGLTINFARPAPPAPPVPA